MKDQSLFETGVRIRWFAKYGKLFPKGHYLRKAKWDEDPIICNRIANWCIPISILSFLLMVGILALFRPIFSEAVLIVGGFVFGISFALGWGERGMTANDFRKNVDALVELLGFDITRVASMSKEALSARASQVLQNLAGRVVNAQKLAANPIIEVPEREVFRRAHDHCLQFDLAHKDWGKFFPSPVERTI